MTWWMLAAQNLYIAQANNQPPPLNDFSTKVLLAVIGAAIGFAFSIALDRVKAKREPVTRVSYDIKVDEAALEVMPELRDKVELSYNGTEVKSLYAVSCTLENTGNQVVRDQYFRFTFPEGTYLLEDYIYPTPDKDIGLKPSPEADDRPHEKRYFLQHLALGESVGFRFISTGDKYPMPVLRSKGKESDIKLEERTAAKVEDDTQHIRMMSVLGIVFIFVSSLPVIDLLYVGLFTAVIQATIQVIIIILSLPHIVPTARIVGDLVKRSLSDERSRTRNVNVGGSSRIEKLLIAERINGEVLFGRTDASDRSDDGRGAEEVRSSTDSQ